MQKKQSITMDDLLNSNPIKDQEVGDVVEGTILSVRKHEVWVDLGAYGIGLVVKREIGYGADLKEGEAVTASIVDTEMDDG